MRLMVALVTEFESHIAGQLALDDEIPLMDQRVPEIRLHTAHRNARVQCERTAGIATRKAAREEITVEALRLADTDVGAVALVARQVHGFVERDAFAAVGAAALVLFTAVEDAVSNANHGLIGNSIGDADARSEVRLIPRGQIIRNVAAVNRHGGEQSAEVRRQRCVTVIALGDEEGVGLDVVVRLAAKSLADRRPQLITDTEVHRQSRAEFPVVLSVTRVGDLLRRNKVRGGNGAAVDYA